MNGFEETCKPRKLVRLDGGQSPWTSQLLDAAFVTGVHGLATNTSAGPVGFGKTFLKAMAQARVDNWGLERPSGPPPSSSWTDLGLRRSSIQCQLMVRRPLPAHPLTGTEGFLRSFVITCNWAVVSGAGCRPLRCLCKGNSAFLPAGKLLELPAYCSGGISAECTLPCVACTLKVRHMY